MDLSLRGGMTANPSWRRGCRKRFVVERRRGVKESCTGGCLVRRPPLRIVVTELRALGCKGLVRSRSVMSWVCFEVLDHGPLGLIQIWNKSLGSSRSFGAKPILIKWDGAEEARRGISRVNNE
ncbi:hypothetical protein GIB67_036682 [Kingdonia uniflora]|uniref:Uncharacterized protein n=1 Tax=Kingdonia uniflora TaxID=39325 RepID=A0A7J7LWE0_9MAGN|nr:hypothetical protein GIB67_036682 [Kingdonia uniflora]